MSLEDYNLSAEDTADCLLADISLYGTEEDDLADLADEVTDYSDGATVELFMATGALLYAALEGESVMQLWFGTELEATEAPNGAYGIVQNYSWENTSADTSDATGMTRGFYLATATVESGELLYSADDYVSLYYDYD